MSGFLSFFSINPPKLFKIVLDHWSALTGCTDVSKSFLKPFKTWLNWLNLQNCPNLGLSCISEGRGSFGGLSDVLMSCSCWKKMSWHSDVQMSSSWPDDQTRVWATFYGWGAAVGVFTSIDADVGDRWAMCSEDSWGILDQDNTSCLFWGIPDLEDLDVVPLESIDAETLIVFIHCLLWWQIICFTPQCLM